MTNSEGEARRARLLRLLAERSEGITGAELAHELGVSRQVVVQDVALLRAAGKPVFATARGYVLLERNASAQRAVLAVRHSREDTREELNILVDHGMRVLDALVEHPVYGELRAPLLLSSRAEVQAFIERMEATEAPLLSDLTGGVHLHTVEVTSQAHLQQAVAELRRHGYLLEPEKDEA